MPWPIFFHGLESNDVDDDVNFPKGVCAVGVANGVDDVVDLSKIDFCSAAVGVCNSVNN